MCIFCGDFISRVHWTDINKKNQSDLIVVGESQRERQRNRLLRVNLCNKILTLYGLKLFDWNNAKYLLEDKKGQQIIVHDLGSLWYDAQKLIGKPINPLDTYLLDSIKKRGEDNGI